LCCSGVGLCIDRRFNFSDEKSAYGLALFDRNRRYWICRDASARPAKRLCPKVRTSQEPAISWRKEALLRSRRESHSPRNAGHSDFTHLTNFTLREYFQMEADKHRSKAEQPR
jgi:hypothetical protein